jgi:hypothetical protein
VGPPPADGAALDAAIDAERERGRGDGGARVDASAANAAAAPAREADPSRDTIDYQSFAGHYAIIGDYVIDVRTGRRARPLPRGLVTFSTDQEHVTIASANDLLTFGRADNDADDYAVTLRTADDATMMTSANGRTTLALTASHDLVIIDAAKKTTFVARPAPPANADASAGAGPTNGPLGAIARDGKLVAWIAGSSAYVRDLDAAATRMLAGTGRDAAAVDLGGTRAGALFGDTLLVYDASSGAEIVRQAGVAQFRFAPDGRTLAWEDATAKLQTIVLLDLERRTTAPRPRGFVVEDPENTPIEKMRFRGQCGSGSFNIAALQGSVVELDRSCTLYDHLTADLVAHKIIGSYSVTPANDYDAEQDVARACKRAHVDCTGAQLSSSGNLLVARKASGATSDAGDEKDGALAVFDAKRGALLVKLASSERMPASFTIAPSPPPKKREEKQEEKEEKEEKRAGGSPSEERAAGVDNDGVARLWDLATGRVLYEAHFTKN